MKKFFFFLLLIYIIKIIQSQSNSEENKIFKKFFDDWTMNMADFMYQYIYTIPVKKHSQVEYYENITKVPCMFQGVVILEDAKSEKEIKVDPDGSGMCCCNSCGGISSLYSRILSRGFDCTVCTGTRSGIG